MPDDTTPPGLRDRDARADALAACPWSNEVLLEVLDARLYPRGGGSARDACRTYPGAPLDRDRLVVALADEGITPSTINHIKS